MNLFDIFRRKAKQPTETVFELQMRDYFNRMRESGNTAFVVVLQQNQQSSWSTFVVPAQRDLYEVIDDYQIRGNKVVIALDLAKPFDTQYTVPRGTIDHPEQLRDTPVITIPPRTWDNKYLRLPAPELKDAHGNAYELPRGTWVRGVVTNPHPIESRKLKM